MKRLTAATPLLTATATAIAAPLRSRFGAPQPVHVRHDEGARHRRHGLALRLGEPAHVPRRRNERPGRPAGAGRGRRRRDHTGARRRARSKRVDARHARRHARQPQSRRLGQAGPHHGRHDAGRRGSSVLFRESPDARPDAGREPRGSLGAVARGVRRGDGGHGALAGHAGGPRRSGGARR